MNVTYDDMCGSPFIGRLESGWVVYHVVFNVGYIVMILSVTAIFFWLFVSGRRRDFEPSYIVCAAVSSLPYTLYKLIFVVNEPSIFTECRIHTSSTIWILTCVIPFVGIHICLYNKIEYHKCMVSLFAEKRKDPLSSKVPSTSIETESVSLLAHLRDLKYRASSLFLRRFYLAAYIIIFLLSCIASGYICSLDCQSFSPVWKQPYIYGIFLDFSYFVGLNMLRKQFNHLVDRENIFGSALKLGKFCIAPGFCFNVLNLMEESVFHFYEKDTIGFSWNIGLDYAMVAYFLVLGFGTIPKNRGTRYVSVDLQIRDVMANTATVKLFQEFLQTNLAVENFFFWKAVERYKSSITKREKFANYIYNRFIKSGSEAQINIPFELRDLVSQRIETGDFTVNFFDEVQKEIENLMNFDLVPRFLDSPYYKTLLTGVDTESIC